MLTPDWERFQSLLIAIIMSQTRQSDAKLLQSFWRHTKSWLEASVPMFTHMHTLTRAWTEGPNGAPHVMLTQFRSVAQSRAGIQNKRQ